MPGRASKPWRSLVGVYNARAITFARGAWSTVSVFVLGRMRWTASISGKTGMRGFWKKKDRLSRWFNMMPLFHIIQFGCENVECLWNKFNWKASTEAPVVPATYVSHERLALSLDPCL